MININGRTHQYCGITLCVEDTIGTVLIKEGVLMRYTKATFGTPENVMTIKVSLFQNVLIREVQYY